MRTGSGEQFQHLRRAVVHLAPRLLVVERVRVRLGEAIAVSERTDQVRHRLIRHRRRDVHGRRRRRLLGCDAGDATRRVARVVDLSARWIRDPR